MIEALPMAQPAAAMRENGFTTQLRYRPRQLFAGRFCHIGTWQPTLTFSNKQHPNTSVAATCAVMVVIPLTLA
jgi:hypothetical protein